MMRNILTKNLLIKINVLNHVAKSKFVILAIFIDEFLLCHVCRYESLYINAYGY